MRRTRRFIAAIPAALLLAGLLLPGLVLAHERRDIGGGKYVAVVGWGAEPAIENQENAAGFRISTKADNKPVEGLEKTLKLTIAFGGGTPQSFPLRAAFNQPGYYVADIIPTKPGSYVWTLTGDIQGTAINETFESGPGRFDDVASASELQFPAVPAGADPAALQAAVQQAQDAAVGARTLAIVGIMVGVLGLLAAGATFALRRPAAATPSAAPLARERQG